uniref:Theileria-specific sub-telomeric protein, putative n=1 Tax=Theileria annulata TaxID=5874 RepID=A0A3B0MUX2_THEAN
MAPCGICNSEKEASQNYTGDACSLLIGAYILAGLSMMLNIRLSYSSAPYALIRFRLPENLFSVFVRRMASALELWCLPSMLLGNIIDLLQKLVEDGHQVRALKYAKDYDIQDKNLGSKLKGKARELQEKAQALSSRAGELQQAATDSGSTLTELKSQAQNLKNAAKKDSTSGSQDGLYDVAEKLANHPGAASPEGKASAVITKFGEVKSYYEALMKAATEDQKKNPHVIAVVREYTALKNIYDQMLNLTKLATKADALQGAAKNNAQSLETAATNLASNVKKLRDGTDAGTDHANAQTVKSQFEKVQQEFNALGDDKKPSVKTPFGALNGVYTNIGFCYKTVKFYSIIIPSIFTQWLNFITYVVLLIVYLIGGDQGHLTTFYWVIAVSGVVFGINMTLLYAVDFYYIPVYIVGENTFPMLTSFIHYLSTLMFGNRRKWNSDFLLVKIDIWVAIIISFVAAVVWTYGYLCEVGEEVGDMKHIHAFGFSGSFNGYQLSPFLMIVVGMGLVYAIYPGIAPGMIVPFYLIDKIEMVLLIATIFPPVIVAMLRRYKPSYSPQHNIGGPFGGWTEYKYDPNWTGSADTPVHGWIWHFFDLLMVTKIVLAAIFIYSLHYRDSQLSRSIINQPKMSTFLSITFYMCHECLLALGFSGFIGNNGGDLILVPQYIGALFMIFLAFYSEGYIIEYKSHDPANWPTTGMKMWNAFRYWSKGILK